MGYQQEVFALISRISGNRNKVVVDRPLCEFMGSLEGGVFLSQLLYWCDKGTKDWFYKPYKEWHAETYLSEYQVRQCAKRCVELGFLETKVRKANGAPTVHYRFNGEVFIDSILKFFRMETEIFQNPILENLGMETEKPQELITETTTETTQKTTTKKERKRKQAAPATPPHPAIETFREVHHRRPNRTQADAIAKLVTDLDLWRTVTERWNTRGYNPLNIDGQLDWYQHPEKMNMLNGGSNGTHRKHNAASSGQDNGGDSPELDPDIQRRLDEHRAKRKAEGSLYYNQADL